MPVKKRKSRIVGKGFIDSISNKVLSNKHNIALPNEKHQIIYLSDGTYNPARFSGPGTNLSTRIKRGDQPLSYVDKTAQAHDLKYALANNTRRSLGFPVTMQTPGSVGPSNGMQRMVALVSVLISSSVSAVPSQ